MIYDISIKKLLAEYEIAFAALDMKRSARLFGDTVVMAGPAGEVVQDNAHFIQMSESAARFYKNAGQISAEIVSEDETPISRAYSLIKVHWRAMFTRPVEFDVSYLVHKLPFPPKIILCIEHPSEKEAMKKEGLI